ncbi:hypothetical protein ACQKQC_05265 [Vibrio fortis]|uniref:hypothetical protein n=1 Tax=Vibrio fortis TaxID=212667 RepID=UPI004067A8F0
MKSLISLIQDQNLWADLFNKEVYPEDPSKLTSEQRKELAEVIECKLSPENLHCDGEISPSSARKKGTALRAAQKELESLNNNRP